MGRYVNPKNDGFCEALETGNYRDKTGLIAYINSVLSTKEKEIAFTRPRRFGKTTACDMLAAYYSSGCKSRALFRGCEIENDPTFEEHLNKHPVIYFDLLSIMSDFIDDNPKDLGLRKFLNSVLATEVAREYPEANVNIDGSLKNAMLAVSGYLRDRNNDGEKSNIHKFIVIIDEWDMVLREEKDNQAMIEDYIKDRRVNKCINFE